MTPCHKNNCDTHASLLRDNEAYCSNCYIELFEPILFRKIHLNLMKKKKKRVVGNKKNIIQISNFQQR